ncbi:DUF397 domain-containing protein [Amycolatopsis sp. NPDC005003]
MDGAPHSPFDRETNWPIVPYTPQRKHPLTRSGYALGRVADTGRPTPARNEVAVPRGNETPAVIDRNRLAWVKSSASSSGGDANCVEVATTKAFVAVRDSKDPGPMIVFSGRSWSAFVHSSSDRPR